MPSVEKYPFNLTVEEKKKVHKFLMQQKKGKIPEPIENLTLNQYFEIVKEAMLALCYDNGVYHDYFNTYAKPKNFKEMTARELAKATMDGRSLFYSDYGDPCGVLDSVDPDDPNKFKWWVVNANYGGHPWETMFGNFVPIPVLKKGCKYKEIPLFSKYSNERRFVDKVQYYSNLWILCFSRAHRCNSLAFRCFIRLRDLGLPVVWDYNEQDIKRLTKRYAVDLSQEPKWFYIDESFFD